MIFCLSHVGELAAYELKASDFSVHSIQKGNISDNDGEVEQAKGLFVTDFPSLLMSQVLPCILSFDVTRELPNYHPDMETPPPNCNFIIKGFLY